MQEDLKEIDDGSGWGSGADSCWHFNQISIPLTLKILESLDFL